jgi:acyl-CoA reductase-like NAD-dependent aldehyde dehydrogenase
VDVNNAVTSALTAFPAWSALSKEKRAEYLLNIAQEIENNFEVLNNML